MKNYRAASTSLLSGIAFMLLGALFGDLTSMKLTSGVTIGVGCLLVVVALIVAVYVWAETD